MVKNLNIALEEDDYQRLKSIKEEAGLTWEEFVTEAGECLRERHLENNDD